MNFTNHFIVSTPGMSTTNELGTRVYINPPTYNNGVATMNVEGQRQLGFVYTLWKASFYDRSFWSSLSVVTNGPEGMMTDRNANAQQGYYVASENIPAIPHALSVARIPTMTFSNGPE